MIWFVWRLDVTRYTRHTLQVMRYSTRYTLHVTITRYTLCVTRRYALRDVTLYTLLCTRYVLHVVMEN
jgi:hypothetical protein